MEEIEERTTLMGWCRDRYHHNCRYTFMQTEIVRMTCECTCHQKESK